MKLSGIDLLGEAAEGKVNFCSSIRGSPAPRVCSFSASFRIPSRPACTKPETPLQGTSSI